jgi:hypothetical protein
MRSVSPSSHSGMGSIIYPGGTVFRVWALTLVVSPWPVLLTTGQGRQTLWQVKAMGTAQLTSQVPQLATRSKEFFAIVPSNYRRTAHFIALYPLRPVPSEKKERSNE